MSLETAKGRVLDAELAAFVADLDYGDLPEETVRTAERAYLDTAGVALAGAVEPPGRIAARMLDASGSAGGDATVIGNGESASATETAFVNGTAAHALDFDDVTPANTGHPSAPMVAAALAVGEAGGATGHDLIAAYVAGFETQHYIGAAIEPGHYRTGWHGTSTLGTFGAAAAVASLLGLDEARTRHALAIAASMPAGLQINFGTMTKPMHVGNAARAGTTAALLAADGFTGDAEAIGADRGFLDLYSGPDGVDRDAPPALGEEWALAEYGVQAKKYPCCYYTHAAIAAASRLADEGGIGADDVESVHVTTSEKGTQILHHDDPATGFEGKFSMPYTVACAIARDRVDLAAFDDATVDDPDVQRVRERVVFDDDPSTPYESYRTTVVIETTDGRRHETTRETPPGREDPLSDDELRGKFDMCARRAIDDGAARAARDRLDALREQDGSDVADLLDALAG